MLFLLLLLLCSLNFVHCEITACDSDNKQSLILSYLVVYNDVMHCGVRSYATNVNNHMTMLQ